MCANASTNTGSRLLDKLTKGSPVATTRRDAKDYMIELIRKVAKIGLNGSFNVVSYCFLVSSLDVDIDCHLNHSIRNGNPGCGSTNKGFH